MRVVGADLTSFGGSDCTVEIYKKRLIFHKNPLFIGTSSIVTESIFLRKEACMAVTEVAFSDIMLKVHPTSDTKQWYMTVEEVAKAYGVDRTNIVHHFKKHSEELREGIERGVRSVHTPGGAQNMAVIYREGVIKLGFFIRSSRAKAFRQFATDLVLQHLEQTGQNSADGFSQLMSKMNQIHNEVLNIRGISETVFGDDKGLILCLVQNVAEMYGVDGRTVWGWVQTECDVASYKRQNLRVINFLRNKLGQGIKLVMEK
jgi:prophage antirepressor-like protein